ncbi:MAG: ABC transporter ATP-binding protein/permease [Actinomycetota bacterium]|nr:ABC transporter ATP-binding protein/permease [Actinomycetota bacterium]
MRRWLAERLAGTQLFETLGGLWPFVRPEGRLLGLIAAATVVLTAVEISIPILVGVFVDTLVSPPSPREAAQTWLDGRNIIALLAVGALLRGYATYQQRSLSGRMGQNVAARIRDTVWSQLQDLPLSYSRRRGPGRLLVRFISDARAVQRLVSRGIVQLAQDVLVVVGVLGVLVYLDWPMGLAAAAIVPVIGGIFWYLNPKLQDASRDMRNRRSRLSAHLNGRIKGLELVKAHGRQKTEKRRVEKLNDKVAYHGSRREVAGGMILGASAGAVALVTALALGLASWEISTGRLTVGELVIFYALVGLLAPSFQRIATVNRTLQEAHISVQRLSQTLAEEPESPREEDLPPLEVGEGVISVEGISFAYPDGTVALEDVNLVARRGELVAVTGPNGAGKSTLLELLPRFLQPASGRVTIDGQDTAGVSLESLRKQIGFVTQDTPLFDGTIAENVTYGVRSSQTTDEQIDRASHIAGLDELVHSLPDGWDTKIREGRRALSEGQRQRVALARVLLADPPIILLDGAASAMDEGTLRALAGRLRELAREKTVIVTTHRRPALLAADRIYSLQEGRIQEVSTEVLHTRHEDTPEKSANSAFDELLTTQTSTNGQRSVRATRGGNAKDDYDEEDDE